MTASMEPRTAADRPVRAAAATIVATLLHGPGRRGTVVAATSSLVAVRVDDGAPSALICVSSPGAVRLPCAMLVAGSIPQARVGTPAWVGDGALRLPGVTVTAARWWPVPLPVLTDRAGCALRAGRYTPPVLDASLLDAAAGLGQALDVSQDGAHAALSEAVDALLGLGPGLTPAGDDVLAAALVTLRAGGSPAAGLLDATIQAAEPFRRTTPVSAGLLGWAGQGMGVPQLTGLLAALDSPGGDVDVARSGLLGVGHTSGAALYLGVLQALSLFAPSAPDRSGAA